MEDEHRLFVQGLMCRGILNSKEVNILHEKCLRVCGIEIPEKRKELNDILARNIHTINNNLSDVGLVVRKGVDEDTGESFFMLVNTQARSVAGGGKELGVGVQSQWSPGELDYLRLVATEILQSEDKCVSSRVALNLTDKVTANKKMTMESAEKAVNKLIEAKWLKMLDDGNIGLDVRFLGEMENWMLEVVGGVAKCQLCRKVVVRGVYCDCEELVAWHRYCLVKSAKDHKAAVKCKKCGTLIHKHGGGVDVGKRGQDQMEGEEEDVQEDSEQASQENVELEAPRPESSGGKQNNKRRISKRMESSDEE